MKAIVWGEIEIRDIQNLENMNMWVCCMLDKVKNATRSYELLKLKHG